MDLRTQYLAWNGGEAPEAAAHLALHLTRDDPAHLKVGYSRPSAILAALEMFPEVDAFRIIALNYRSGWTTEDLPTSIREA